MRGPWKESRKMIHKKTKKEKRKEEGEREKELVEKRKDRGKRVSWCGGTPRPTLG